MNLSLVVAVACFLAATVLHPDPLPLEGKADVANALLYFAGFMAGMYCGRASERRNGGG